MEKNKIDKKNKALIMHNGVSYSAAIDLAYLFFDFFSKILNDFVFLDINECLWFIHTHFLRITTLYPNKFKTSSVLQFSHISPQKLEKLLSDIDECSSEGSVSIPSCVFKNCSESLAVPLSFIFNSCIDTNIIPDDWKISFITPVYKGKGKKNSIENYRPISILSPVAKLFESYIGEQLTHHFITTLYTNKKILTAQKKFISHKKNSYRTKK